MLNSEDAKAQALVAMAQADYADFRLLVEVQAEIAETRSRVTAEVEAEKARRLAIRGRGWSRG